jgi:hypothetical protein
LKLRVRIDHAISTAPLSRILESCIERRGRVGSDISSVGVFENSANIGMGIRKYNSQEFNTGGGY